MKEKYDPEYARKILKRVERRGGHRILFENFEVYHPENLERKDQNKPRLYLANHLSHADYLLAWMQFQRSNVKMPMIAAGKNLDLKILKMMGIDFGRLGTFWINRDKINKSNREEALNLRKKVEELVSNGEDILCFPEGGRSYNGKLFANGYKTGIIKATLKANTNIEIIPMAFGYDTRIEENFIPAIKRVKDRGKLGNTAYVALDIGAFLLRYLTRGDHSAYLNIGKSISLEEISKGEKSLPKLISITKKTSTKEIKKLYQEIREKRFR